MNRRTVRGIIAATACAGMFVSIAACGGGGSTGGDTGSGGSGGQTKLTFAYMGTAEQQEQWNKLFAAFEKENPDIKLEAQGIAVDNWAAFFNKISTQIAGGQVPDVIQVATEGQRMFASKGILEPLDEYIKKDQTVIDEYYADMNPNLVEWNAKYGSPDGKTYYLPGEFNTMALYCNTEVFDKAGVSLPKDGADWTWDEFAADAKTVKDKTGAYIYDAPAAYFVGVMPWVTSNGGSTLNDDWSAATFNTPPVVESATYLRDLVAKGYAPEPGGTFDAYTAFSQGKLACFGGGRWPVINVRNMDMVDKTQIVKFPVKVEDGSPVGWNGYPIMKDSKNKDAAWQFIKYLISKEGSSYFAEIGGTIVPARESVAKSEAYLANSPKGTELLYDALAYSIPIPSPDRGAEVQATIEDTWKQILSGNVTPQEGTDQAQQKLTELVG